MNDTLSPADRQALTDAAKLLAKRRKGTTERKTDLKRSTARANLAKARTVWASLPPEERKRDDKPNPDHKPE